MLLLIIAIAVFQMLSQGPERRGWGGTAGNADVFLLSIDSCYLSETGAERKSLLRYQLGCSPHASPSVERDCIPDRHQP